MSGLPDLRWARRNLSVISVAEELNLEYHDRQIRCWRPDNHQHGDRTASVGVDTKRNRVRCFVCDARQLSPIDLVQSVLGLDTYGALLWLDQRFAIPRLPKGKHIARRSQSTTRFRVGVSGSRLEPLIRSGLFAEMGDAEIRLLIVLDAFSDPMTDLAALSYRALRRYTGIGSEATVSSALKRLSNLSAVEIIRTRGGDGLPACNRYRLTLEDARFLAHINQCAESYREEIAAQRQMRTKSRRQRISALSQTREGQGHVFTGITSLHQSVELSDLPLHPECSVKLTRGSA